MKGFTLTELLIVIGLTVILAAAASPIYTRLQVSAQLNESTSQIIQSLRTAREKSRSGVNNSNHGVYFDINVGNDRYTLYQGSSYAARDANFDRTTELDITILLFASDFDLIGTDVDINFSRTTGAADNIGNFTIAHETSGNRIINVNSLGAVEEE